MRTFRLTAIACVFGTMAIFSARSQNQNVSINSTGAAPDASAILDVSSANKGLLIPRVSLQSTTDVNTIHSPANSLLVFNTNASMSGTGGGIGYWFWNSSANAWQKLIVLGGGPVGPTGPTGSAGSNGTPGITGPTGAQGVPGITGATGAQGATGNDGQPGATGAQGATGNDGQPGATGVQGATGIAGITGPTGANGATGINGITGPTGANGATGINGTPGSNGSTGATGPAGPVGCTTANYIMKSNGTAATCTQAPIFESSTSPFDVGIGTAAPNAGYQLDVEGIGQIAAAFNYNASGNYNGIECYTDNATYGTWPVFAFASNAPSNGDGAGFGAGDVNTALVGVLESNHTYSFASNEMMINLTSSLPSHSGGLIASYCDGPTSPFNTDASGAVGYCHTSSNFYAFYGFSNAYTAGAVGGRVNPNNIGDNSILPNDQIGMGMNGGVMGGWINSPLCGMYIKGDRYGLYTDGKTFTNDMIVQLQDSKDLEIKDKVATYVPTSTSVDITTRGNSTLENGRKDIRFGIDFSGIISDNEPVVITVTPLGESNGVYVTNVTNKGFTVIENNKGNSNVQFNWIAVGVKQGYEKPQIPTEVLSKTYNQNMSNVMISDNNEQITATPIWWDGNNIRFDAIPKGFKNPPSTMKAKMSFVRDKKSNQTPVIKK